MIISVNGVDGKHCTVCGMWKPLDDFPHDRTHGQSQGGKHCQCKRCQSEIRKLVRKGFSHTEARLRIKG